MSLSLPFALSSILSYRPLSNNDDYSFLEEMSDASEESHGKASHLCVLVHGLWGNPGHLDYLASALRERHGKDQIYILAAQRNSGSYTYDGIELGGERVAHEIEDTLEQLTAKGYNIQKISVVGYSLGGLVARYAIGLLEANGTFDRIQPVNFTTFASPHVGVRSSFKGWSNHLWNVLGARTVSASGRQMFLIDDFRGTGKPLLSVMADPDSIFRRGLAKFKNRSVYANIVNDLSTVFYTTAISKVDPFSAPQDVNINYMEGYEQIIIDPDQYILPAETVQDQAHGFSSWLGINLKKLKKRSTTVGINICLVALLPIAAAIFLIYSGVQHLLSQQRIKLYEQGKTSLLPERYRVPLMIQDVQAAVETVFENLNAARGNEYLTDQERKHDSRTSNTYTAAAAEESSSTTAPELPVLALTPQQFDIIDSLNALGIKKYPVHIHKVRHSHAAIIVRMPKPGFSEGKIVVKHWLDVGFEL